MDAILEFVFTMCESFFSNMKYKKPQVRTWVLSGFYSFVGLLLAGTCAGGAVLLYRQESAVGAAVLSAMTLVALIVSGVVIFRGHKHNWNN